MELTLAQEQILRPFINNAVSCLQSMAGISASAGKPFEEDVGCLRLNDYAIVVETSGMLQGRIVLHLYPEAALAIGNRMRENQLGESSDASSLDEGVAEALSEYGNTVVGLASGELLERGLRITLAPPCLMSGMEQLEGLFKGVSEVITVPIHANGIGRFYLNYFLCSELD